MLYSCSKDVIDHLTEKKYIDAVNEIKRLIAIEEAGTKRFNDHLMSVKEFLAAIICLTKWDVDFSYSCDEYTLEFERHSYTMRKHVESMGLYYSEGYDYDEIDIARVSFPSELVLCWMHLWVNKYKDQNYDIFQSKLQL